MERCFIFRFLIPTSVSVHPLGQKTVTPSNHPSNIAATSRRRKVGFVTFRSFANSITRCTVTHEIHFKVWKIDRMCPQQVQKMKGETGKRKPYRLQEQNGTKAKVKLGEGALIHAHTHDDVN